MGQNITFPNPIYNVTTKNIKYPLLFYLISHKKSHKIPDLRGSFWEYQIPKNNSIFSIKYVSDRSYTINNVSFKPLVYINESKLDKKLCIKTQAILQDFVEQDNFSWALRLTDDSFVYLPNLIQLLQDLEKNYNPNKDFVLKSAIYSYKGVQFPHGSAILFSKNAAKELVNDMDNYFQKCKKSADDIALGLWANSTKKPHNISNWESLQFAFNWPQFLSFPSIFSMFFTNCNSRNEHKYLRRQINHLAIIHFHNIDMSIAKNIGHNILYRNEQDLWNNDKGRPMFCFQSNSLNILFISLFSALLYQNIVTSKTFSFQ